MSTTALRVVRPVSITPAMLIGTGVPEADYGEWNASASYGVSDRVIVAATHKVYQSTVASNVGNDPTAVVAEPKWLEVGATNRWKAFDKSVSSQTVFPSNIWYSLRPGQAITSLGVLNIKGGTSMRVRMIDPTYGTVHDKTYNLASTPVSTGWWEWVFGERRTPTQVLITDLPSYPTAEIVIEIIGTTELAVGVILLGQMKQFTMGVLRGARVGIQDYSRKERNEFGDVLIVERAFAKRANFSMLMTSGEVDAFNDFLAEVRATPCLWIGSSKYESTTVYGFYKSFDIILNYTDYADSEIELEGLT
ncbi:carbohydrate-binding protein [Diaphorobacter sp. HDW4B]|uniref:carbohydrate-binding protein n=1 Tax=Diaphorobacter sp. HDW4B TaxID=2714925 RepID=UPI00140C83E6|nr:carbohydrate-binding protein [Diaphorobacter sp. HDW4B]QIL69559.1 carbohydrate-binding protein [Diaphorobacter sp. HDW4B]QIL72327.1 carbohydrate-binding protein [Diaphorobacter sp. HDW4B]